MQLGPLAKSFERVQIINGGAWTRVLFEFAGEYMKSVDLTTVIVVVRYVRKAVYNKCRCLVGGCNIGYENNKDVGFFCMLLSCLNKILIKGKIC